MTKYSRLGLTKSEQMARVRSKNTAAEVELRRALWKNGLRFRLKNRLPGTPDILFPKPRIALFVDGCFWHGCPIHYTEPKNNNEFWRAKLARNRQRDARVDHELVLLGWTVLRIWEHQVNSELAAVVQHISGLVKSVAGNSEAGRFDRTPT